jgi:hypothetical protein
MNEILQATTSYFSAVAQVSGGLLGLVFVAISFNTKALGDQGNPALRDLARQIFADFLVVLMVSLFMLFPAGLELPVGIVLMLLAVTGILRIVRGLVMALRTKQGQALVIQRFGLSFLGNAGLFAAGVLAFRNTDMQTFEGLVLAAPLMLLVSGSRSAWILFVHK